MVDSSSEPDSGYTSHDSDERTSLERDANMLRLEELYILEEENQNLVDVYEAANFRANNQNLTPEQQRLLHENGNPTADNVMNRIDENVQRMEQLRREIGEDSSSSNSDESHSDSYSSNSV